MTSEIVAAVTLAAASSLGIGSANSIPQKPHIQQITDSVYGSARKSADEEALHRRTSRPEAPILMERDTGDGYDDRSRRLFQEGLTSYWAGEWPLATAKLRKAANLGHEGAAENLALLHAGRQDFDTAWIVLSAARWPLSDNAYLLYAALSSSKGSAAAHIDRLRSKPAVSGNLKTLTLATTLLRLGLLAEAKQEYLLGIGNGCSKCRIGAACASILSGDFEAASELLEPLTDDIRFGRAASALMDKIHGGHRTRETRPTRR